MKKATGLLLGAVLAVAAVSAQARDTELKLSIQEAMNSAQAARYWIPASRCRLLPAAAVL